MEQHAAENFRARQPFEIVGSAYAPEPELVGKMARGKCRIRFCGTGFQPVSVLKNKSEDRQDACPTDFENLVFELKSHPLLTSLASFRDGWFYIQDPSTLLAPMELGAQPGETILDLCAAPGGKTTFIAQLVNNGGKIVACDISEERLKLVQENCQRLGVTCVETVLISENRKSQIANQKFDRVLVDAPCSNTGVMRRRVDLRWRISPEEISRLQQTQLDLLKLAATKLKSGGVLIYSTCSLEPEENSEMTKEFLLTHENFKLENERELLPFVENVDGAYVARLEKMP